MGTLAFLGPSGTFTQRAAYLYMEEFKGKDWRGMEYPSIPELITAVDRGEADHGVVPIENSQEGSVNVTLDMLTHQVDLYIQYEIVLPIIHNLLANQGTAMENITKILSHPQAVAQCRYFLENNLKGVEVYYTLSTAEAAKRVVGSLDSAAISTLEAAQAFGLEVLKEKIQDNGYNSTRFVVIGKEIQPPTGRDKSSIVLTVDHRPGSLYKILEVFARFNINLTKIESRPAKTMLGQYLFYIDFEGHSQQDIISHILEIISINAKFYKYLGSYPYISYGDWGANGSGV
ncbi:MAG: prephenate dehydratase [Mahellales bacterium]|jgi:prephenate dehydratase